MGLSIVRTADERLAGGAVRELLSRELEHPRGGGNVLVLAPSLAQALDVQRELAAARGLSMGVDCTTAEAWCQLRWALYGDGRALVSAPERAVLMALVVADAADRGELDPLDGGKGTVELLCDAARRWKLEPVAGLSAGEVRAVELLGAYERKLVERGLVEPARAAALLPTTMAGEGAVLPACVMLAPVGMGELRRPARELALAYAREGELAYVVADDGGPACAVVREGAALLAAQARERGIAVEEREAGAWPVERVRELADLRRSLFAPRGAGIVPKGAVELIEPAGPLAVDEAVASRVARMAGRGTHEVVVVAGDVAAAWRGLAPKFFSRGVSVRAQLSMPVLKTDMGAGFVSFARAVARLDELAASWPVEPLAPAPDMTWWPPRVVSDFLLSDACGVGPEVAWRRDASWRGNRILTPASVLATLQNKNATSNQVAGATRELLRGHVAAAAARLLNLGVASEEGTKQEANASGVSGASDVLEQPEPPVPSAERELGRALDEAALRAVGEAGQALKRCGVSLNAGVELPALVELAARALGALKVVVRPELACENASCSVRIVSSAQVARLAPASVDALVYLGLDAAGSPISVADGALDRLLARTGVDEPTDGLATARASFAAAVAAPRKHLLLVCPSHDASASETFPAVMLSELLSCYATNDRGRCLLEAEQSSKLDEGRVVENLSATGEASEARKVAAPAVAGQLSESLRRLVIVPRDGVAELPEGRPSLSASQVETYLECPLKWFTLRRLGLDDCDARFSNVEIGTFVHRVLEVTHRRLFLEAAAAQGLVSDPLAEAPEQGLFWFDPRVRVGGSRVCEQTLEHATELMHAEFAEHLAHQRLSATTRNKQALIAHTPSQERRLAEVEHDIATTLEYEATRLAGFEPRLFEGRFGGASGLVATYAGADFVGTIDRIDVDAEGRALVIDYKHKSALLDEYALKGKGDVDWGAEFALPGRVQTLIYASIARRLLAQTDSGLELVGAVYLGTKGRHQIAGALSARDAAAVLGADARPADVDRMTLPVPGARSFADLLDRTEEAVAQVIEDMLAGRVEARPSSPKACAWCPAMNCERRQS